MMNRSAKHIIITMILLIISANFLPAENILKILEGYGRDSISTFSTQNAQAEAARLFNLLLESNGKLTADRAEQYLNDAKSPAIKAYLSVMLADYSFVNKAQDSGLRYLKRAVDEHDPIRNDSYYRLVLSRAQQNIGESPGKEKPGKTTVLSDFNPTAVKVAPVIPEAKTAIEEKAPAAPAVKKDPAPAPPPASVEVTANFRIQVGAFSVQENAQKKLDFFEERGYPVRMDKRERTSGYLYLARIGAYSTYNEAKQALSELKTTYPSEDGIVIKVEK